MADLSKELENEFSRKGWLVPKKIECNAILFDGDNPNAQGTLGFDTTSGWKLAIPQSDTLASFIALSEGTPRQIVAFAKRYGPLGVRRRRIAGGSEIVEIWEDVTSSVEDGFVELLDSDLLGLHHLTWRGRARVTKQLIDVAQKIRNCDAVEADEWLPLDLCVLWGRFINEQKRAGRLRPNEVRKLSKDEVDRGPAEFLRWYRAKKRYERPADPWARLENAMTAVLGQNPLDISMRFSLGGGRLTFNFANSLNDYLIVQTLHAVAYGAGTEMIMCSNPDCRDMFKPHHRIPDGKRAWCPKCSGKVSMKFTMRRKYQRDKQPSEVEV